MRTRDRLRRLDENPVSGAVAWLATYVTGPVGTVGGIVMIIAGLVLLATGGRDAVGLLGMGAAWLIVGLICCRQRSGSGFYGAEEVPLSASAPRE